MSISFRNLSIDSREDFVLVTIILALGSTSPGAKYRLLLSRTEQFDATFSLFKSLETARALSKSLYSSQSLDFTFTGTFQVRSVVFAFAVNL